MPILVIIEFLFSAKSNALSIMTIFTKDSVQLTFNPGKIFHYSIQLLLSTFSLIQFLCDFLQGWFSPGQVFVLDEYCARYGVRGCHRHLCYLSDLLERAENGIMIDPTLIHYSFAFCASHVHGNR